MTISIVGIILLVMSMLTLALQRFYSCIPAKELKRLANRGDHLAVALYRPVAYGVSMRLLLWLVFALLFSGGVVLVSNGLVGPAAFVLVTMAVAGAVIVLSLRLTVHSARVAVRAAPVLSWVLSYAHTPLHAVGSVMNKARRHDAHSGLYEKEDVVALINQQREQLDNRIPERDLDIMERAARFGDMQAADIVLPMSRVKLVNKDEPVGPILLKELHDSGQTSFLAYDTTPERVVGTLFLRDAVGAREGGQVAELVQHKLVYVHEDFSLRDVLQAFVRTSQHMVVVVNAFEEAVGIITLERLLSQLLGDLPADEAMAYDDKTTVASYRQSKYRDDEPAEAEMPAGPGVSEAATGLSSPEATEVVE